jgi:hypothetical protein
MPPSHLRATVSTTPDVILVPPANIARGLPPQRRISLFTEDRGRRTREGKDFGFTVLPSPFARFVLSQVA